MLALLTRAVAVTSLFLVACQVRPACAASIVYSIEVTLENETGERNTQIVNIHADETVSQAVATFCSNGMCGDSQQAVEDYVQGVVNDARKNLYVNEILQKSIETATVYDAQNQAVSLDSNVAANEGKYLYDLIVNNKLSRTLEVGMAYGISSLYMSQAHQHLMHPSQSHVSIDPFQSTQWKNIGVQNLKRAGLRDIVDVREEKSFAALPEAVKNGETYQLIFIDGMHLFDYTLLDFFYADLMLEVGGFMVFDDGHMPSVAKVISHVLTNRAYRSISTDLSHRVAVMQKIKDDDRNWDFHAAF